MEIIKEPTIDLLDTKSRPALSSTSDIPVVETKPDATPEAPAEPPAEAGEAEPTEESATSPESTSESGETAKKQSKGVQKRLDELTKRAAEEREEKLRLMALLEERNKQAPTPKEPEVKELSAPKRNDFPDDDSWALALTEYAKQSARAEIEAEAKRKADEEAERKSQAERASVQRSYDERVASFTEKHPDFAEVAYAPDAPISQFVADAVLRRESGPDLLYWLASKDNRDEAKRIYDLPPSLQLMELGLLEARLKAPPVKPTVSNAPAPITPTKPGNEPARKSPNDESMDEYYKRRTAEERAKRTSDLRREARH